MLAREPKEVKGSMTILGFCRWLIGKESTGRILMQETWVWSLGQDDPLEKGMTIYSSILAWEIPWTAEPGGLRSMESKRVGHDWSNLTCTHINITNKHFCYNQGSWEKKSTKLWALRPTSLLVGVPLRPVRKDNFNIRKGNSKSTYTFWEMFYVDREITLN